MKGPLQTKTQMICTEIVPKNFEFKVSTHFEDCLVFFHRVHSTLVKIYKKQSTNNGI